MKTSLEYALDLADDLAESSRNIDSPHYGRARISQDGIYTIERFIKNMLAEIKADPAILIQWTGKGEPT